MNKKDLKEIKAKLEAEKEQLEKELLKFAKKNPKNSDDYIAEFKNLGDDETENASEVDKYSLNLSLEKTLEKSLRDVKKSLSRIDKDDYGICKYCQQPINVKRLKARPTSGACIACKTKLKSL